MRRTRLKNGASVNALAASQASVRGPHPQRLRGDEIDEMKQEIWDSAKGQPMTSPSGIKEQTVASSTHQYPDKTMQNELKLAKERGWPIYEWCYRESRETQPAGWLTEVMVEKKKLIMSVKGWLAEVELQEPSPEGRAIDIGAVEDMFDKSLGDEDGAMGRELIFEEPFLPDRSKRKDREYRLANPHYFDDDGKILPPARYALGADWGKSVDKTVFVVLRIDVTPWRLVAFSHLGRRSWPLMIGAFGKLAIRYGGGEDLEFASCAHDATGLGDVVHDILTIPTKGLKMVGAARTNLIREYVVGIENRDLVSPFIHYMESEHRYVTENDFSGSGHLPDSFVAGAMAYHAALLRLHAHHGLNGYMRLMSSSISCSSSLRPSRRFTTRSEKALLPLTRLTVRSSRSAHARAVRMRWCW